MPAHTASPSGDRVRVSVQVDAPPPVAFEVFTHQIDLWWRHGMAWRSGARGTSVVHLEPRLGGRLFEQLHTATEPLVQTGTVIGWEPPHHLVLEWRGVNFAPDERTTVDVRFEAHGDGTLVTLVHSGFAALRPDHPVRHGQPVAVFIARTALWWSQLLTSLRQRVGDSPRALGPSPAR